MATRPIRPADADAVAAFRAALWTDTPLAVHREEIAALIAGRPRSTLPLTVLVAEGPDGTLDGFLEIGLRSHADGCDPAQSVGFVEGWYVRPEARSRGVGAELMCVAEAWAREHGCRELASDTWSDNAGSISAHQALGFEIVDTCVNFRKPL